MRDFYKKMLETAKSAGLKIISDDKCCQLLAWLLYPGVHYEAVVFHQKLNIDIHAAQDRLNLHGSEYPNAELLSDLNKYAIEAKRYYNSDINKPDWIFELEKHYGLKPYRNGLERD